MADRRAEKLRREIDNVSGRKGRRFPANLKQRATDWMVQRRAAGASADEIAAAFGLSLTTVLRWSARRPTSLVPVQVIADPVVVRTVSVVSPSGFRVDGLSPAEATGLLRMLG